MAAAPWPTAWALAAEWRFDARAMPFPDGTDTLSFENLEGIVLVEANASTLDADTAGVWVVDTGAGYLALDAGLARRLGLLDRIRPARAIELTERPLGRFRMGALDRHHVTPTLAFDAGLVRDITDRPVLGLIGQQLYQDRALWIDYQQRLLALVPIAGGDSASAVERSRRALDALLGAAAVAVRFRLAGDGKVLVTARIGDRSKDGRSAPLTMIVDTGSSKTVLFEPAISGPVAGAERWRSLRGLSAPTLVGPAPARIVRLPWLELDPGRAAAAGAKGEAAAGRSPQEADPGRAVRVTDTDVVLVRSPLSEMLATATGTPVHGLIGYSFLRRFRIAIDYPNRVLWLDPVPRLADERPHEYTHVGLQLARNEGRMQVTAVAHGSPAARAGIRAGDELIAIDGRRLADHDLLDAARSLEGPEGTTVRLAVRRGDAVRELRLRRRRLL